ncbi:MAG: hypothetical protein NVSMB22_16200 [Chloroflexota bacterium]
MNLRNAPYHRGEYVTYGVTLDLKKLRVLAVVVPVVFVLGLEVVNLLLLHPLFGGNTTLRFFVILLILLAGVLLFSFWVFAIIERQRRDLAQSAELLSNVKDHAIFMLDPDGRVRSWSPGAERVKGYRADEIIGKPLATFYLSEDVEQGIPAKNLEVAARAGRLETEGWRVRKDGSHFWADVVSTAVRNEDGNVLGFAHVARDTTERKRADERIQILNEQLEVRVRDLATANEEITRHVRELDAATTAIVSISSALDLSQVLQTIVDSARDLLQSRYAALGVADEQGHILQFITSGITQEQRAAIGPLPRGHGLLGELIREGRPLRTPQIGEHPHSSGFPPDHPPMTSLLGVPILYQGRPVGNLYLTDKIGSDEFSEEDQDLLMLLANHAAVAIENARLYQEVRASRDGLQEWSTELEARAAERTREIERYSKELTTRVLQAQEEERKRLARELHDDTAQSLSTLLIHLDLLEPVIPVDGDLLRSKVDRIRDLTKRTLDNVRALSHDLRPTILDDFGLEAALRWYADEYRHAYGLPVEMRIEHPAQRLSPEVELALFRIAQEALTNSGKHAEAEWVRLSLAFSTATAELIVEDDGQGFDPGQSPMPTRQGGLGLYGMQERAELLGATLNIESSPDTGTRVMVTVPLRQEGSGATTLVPAVLAENPPA